MRRYTNTSEAMAGTAERELTDVAAELEQTEADMQTALQQVNDKWAGSLRQIEEVRVSPLKKDIYMVLFGIGWVPYWYATINSVPAVLPASSSGLSYAQEPISYA